MPYILNILLYNAAKKFVFITSGEEPSKDIEYNISLKGNLCKSKTIPKKKFYTESKYPHALDSGLNTVLYNTWCVNIQAGLPDLAGWSENYYSPNAAGDPIPNTNYVNALRMKLEVMNQERARLYNFYENLGYRNVSSRLNRKTKKNTNGHYPSQWGSVPKPTTDSKICDMVMKLSIGKPIISYKIPGHLDPDKLFVQRISTFVRHDPKIVHKGHIFELIEKTYNNGIEMQKIIDSITNNRRKLIQSY